MSWYFKLPSYASRLHTWIVFNIPLAIDTLRLRMCVVSYPYTMFWRGLHLSFFTSINTVFSLTLGKHIGSFTGKEIIQYQIFSYFSIHFLPTSLVQFFLLFLFLFSIVFFLGRVCIRYILVKVNDTQNCFSNKNKSLYNERFRNDVVW